MFRENKSQRSITRACRFCTKDFKTRDKTQVFCSDRCREEYHCQKRKEQRLENKTTVLELELQKISGRVFLKFEEIPELRNLIVYLQRHDIYDVNRERTLHKIHLILKDNGYIPEFSIYPGRKRIQVDFANPITKHIVEFDGKGHGNHLKQFLVDEARDKITSSMGWTTTRIKHK